jgi:SAM-dependent MidA family methyltransferase
MIPKKRFILQDYVSRSKSIRNTFSNRCFDDGIDTFFNHKVPFSYSTGSILANRFCSLIKTYIKSTKKSAITLLELGAGSGKLSHEILSILAKDPQTASVSITLLITDSNPVLIKQMQAQYTHNSQIMYKCFNPLTDSYSTLASFDIAIMCYLLDCLDTYHLEVDNGKFYEWKITSYIDNTDYLITSSKQKLKYYDAKTLSKYILKLNSNESSLKLSHCIKESFKRFELPTTHELYKHKLATEILSKNKTSAPHKFNLSIDSLDCINKLTRQLNTSQMAIIFDFGTPNNKSLSTRKNSYKATYGMCNFYSISFPHLHYLATKHNVFFEQTEFKKGESQCLMLHRLKSNTAIRSTFKQAFNTPGNTRLNTTFKQIKSYSARKTKQLSISAYITKKLLTLSEFEKKDYEFNIRLCEILIDHKHYEHAHYNLDILIKSEPKFSRSAYFLKAKLFQLENKPKQVIELVNKLNLHSLKHSGILYQYCLSLCKCEKYKEFETFFYRFLQHSDYFIPWRFFIILHYIFSIKTKQTKLIHLNQFLSLILKENPSLIHSEIIDTIKNLLP